MELRQMCSRPAQIASHCYSSHSLHSFHKQTSQQHVQDNALPHELCSWRWNALGLSTNFAFVWANVVQKVYMLHKAFLSCHRGTRHDIIFNKPTQTTQTARERSHCCRSAIFIRENNKNKNKSPQNGKKQKSSKKNFRFSFPVAFANYTIGAFLCGFACDPTHC